MAIAGIPLDFLLFALTLLGVALFHNQTLYVALTGVVVIAGYKLALGDFAGTPGWTGLAGLLGHEWVTLANLLGLLLGFALLADHFEQSGLPALLPRFLPDDWKGGLCLLLLVFAISSFLDNIAAAMIAREVGVDPSRINYVAFRGGGEATAAILGGNVTVGGSGYSEFAEYITAGKMKAIAVTSAQRLKGVPTLKEQGLNIEIGNWRGVYGASGINEAQRKALTDMVLAALKTKSWQESLAKNDWTPAVLSGPAFDKFVDDEFASLRATMVKSGMV